MCAGISSQASLDSLARSLGTVARRALVHGQKATVSQVVHTLLGLPVDPGLHNLARYYEIHVPGRFCDPQSEVAALETVFDHLPTEYRPRPLLVIAERYRQQGRLSSAASFYIEAAKAALHSDLLTEVQAIRGLAIVRSTLGDHRGAFELLRGLANHERFLRPAYEPEYLAYLNSVAMELAELGRVGEANAVIDYVLRKGTATGCLLPNWVDTKQEVLEKLSQPAPPLVFAFSRALEEPPQSDAAQNAPTASCSESSSKKLLPTGIPLDPVACLPTRRSRARLLAAKPQFLLPRETRPGSSNSPRAPPPVR